MFSFLVILLVLVLMGAVWALGVMLLSNYKRAANAVLKRNFVSYFANPTGYVFILVFLLLGLFAAFWPNEFFNANLANLDQLNRFLPLVMLVFIPAITMSVWAEERRQGTDELLLTIPAADFDIVLGKFLSAVAIFTVSLTFSLLLNYGVLSLLGSPDVGLFIATYIGYWFLGMAMLAIGMVASFLTGNLTVGFVLGLVFNLPLAAASYADVIFGADTALEIEQWSLAEYFLDFGRGVISLSGITYFATIIVVCLYLSMVLIGRRHWLGGRDSGSMFIHYAIRTAALLVLAVGLIVLTGQFDVRRDITSEQLSSLSPQTRTLIKNLDAKRPVHIEAYVSPVVPESFVQTRLDLLSTLREIDALGGDRVTVRVHDTDTFSESAQIAEQQYGIESQQVPSTQRGAMNITEVYMGLAVRSGLETVVVPFINRGIPVEYEVVRSVCTVSDQSRKKVGVLQTDAQLYGQFNMQTMSSTRNELIIDELEKQYDVVQVNAEQEIPDDLDVLLAVQPSSLSPEQLDNFVAAVRGGQPTAIFEDPFPFLSPNVPGTSAPRQPPGGMNPMAMMQGRQPPPPKGNITILWDLLGVDYAANKVIWQDYNPYKSVRQFDEEKEFVFVDVGADAGDTYQPFNPEREISSGLQQVLFLFPGAVRQLNASELDFESLVTTGHRTGTVEFSEIMQQSFSPFMPQGLNPNRRRLPTRNQYVLAAHIRGTPKAAAIPMLYQQDGDDEADPADESADTADAASGKPKKNVMDVVLVTDIDVLYSAFFNIRAMGQNDDAAVNFSLDNVTFVLNVLDELAGDDRFIAIRNRRPAHRTLTTLESRTAQYRDAATQAVEEFNQEFESEREAAQEKFNKEIEELQQRKDLDPLQLMRMVELKRRDEQRKLDARIQEMETERDEKVKQAQRSAENEIRSIQNQYKVWPVALAPIPLLCVAAVVFFNRRAREREGVSQARLRK